MFACTFIAEETEKEPESVPLAQEHTCCFARANKSPKNHQNAARYR
jgi:hypothetical protein